MLSSEFGSLLMAKATRAFRRKSVGSWCPSVAYEDEAGHQIPSRTDLVYRI